VDPIKYLNEIIYDVDVAILANGNMNRLTRSVLGAVERWFQDVDIIIPMNDMQLDSSTKSRMLETALKEMHEAFTLELERIKNGGVNNPETHEALAMIVDPLWREVASLHAEIFNIEFEALRPKDFEEINERISVMEEITGMNRKELQERASKDLRVRKMLGDMGLLPTDLND